MEFNLSNFENYKTYFETVATESVHIAGFMFGDTEIGQKEAASWEGLKLWAWPANKGRITDQLSDNYILGREASLWIGGPCSSELHADEDAYYNNCEVIAKKVISRMIKDKYEGLLSISFSGVQIQRADMYPSSTKMIGCEIIFTIHDPDGFEYNEDDWAPVAP
jgi:hypothetical protein